MAEISGNERSGQIQGVYEEAAISRKLQKDGEKSIAKDAKTNAKKFWRHVRPKMKTSVRISDLKSETDDGKKSLVKKDVDKTQTLPDFFSSVFTRAAITEIPELEDKIIDLAS